MRYDELEEAKEVDRAPMKPMFIWLPLLTGFVLSVLWMILKFTEKTESGFTTWGVVIILILLSFGLPFGASILLYRLLSLKDKTPQGRRFNTQDQCDKTIRKRLQDRTGYTLEDFTETGESIEGVGWFGEGRRDDQDLIYFHLYRIRKGQFMRYLLVVMNTEVGKEDIMNTKQSVMNFPNIEQTVRNMCNLICRNPQKTITKETRFYDEVAGRGRTEKTESPLDAPENGDDLEELPQ